MSAFLIKSKVSAGKNVLELGSGCGLPGTVAAWCGARSVCLTDGFHSGVEAANHTLSTNLLPCPAEARLFKWSQENSQTFEGIDLILGKVYLKCYESKVNKLLNFGIGSLSTLQLRRKN